MPGGYYVALSGMRTRLDQLDRLSEDLANSATSGFKGERVGNADARRPTFGAALETAIDVSMGQRRLDTRQGTITPTGRDLDIAMQGDGYLAVQTAEGTRYTRNGHLMRTFEGTLTTSDGAVVLGEDGPLKLDGPGNVTFDDDGSVRNGGKVVGKLSVFRFEEPGKLLREGGALLRPETGQTAEPVEETSTMIKTGALESSNVSVVERIGELTSVSRSFEALQKAVSVMMNDVDGRAIDALGRR